MVEITIFAAAFAILGGIIGEALSGTCENFIENEDDKGDEI